MNEDRAAQVNIEEIHREVIRAALAAGRDTNWEAARALRVEIPTWYRAQGAMLVLAGERLSPEELAAGGWNPSEAVGVLQEALAADRPVNAAALAQSSLAAPAHYGTAGPLLISTGLPAVEVIEQMTEPEMVEWIDLRHQLSETRGTAFTVEEEAVVQRMGGYLHAWRNGQRVGGAQPEKGADLLKTEPEKAVPQSPAVPSPAPDLALPIANLVEQSLVKVTMVDGREYEGIVGVTHGITWVRDSAGEIFVLDGPGHIRPAAVTILKHGMEVLAAREARRFGEQAYVQPRNRDEFEAVLWTLGAAITELEGRSVSEPGFQEAAMRALQLNAQFDRVADEIGLARRKRNYILAQAGRRARGLAIQPVEQFTEGPDEERRFEVPKPSDFEPDPTERRRRRLKPAIAYPTRAAVEFSLEDAQRRLRGRLSAERRKMFERIVQRREAALERGLFREAVQALESAAPAEAAPETTPVVPEVAIWAEDNLDEDGRYLGETLANFSFQVGEFIPEQDRQAAMIEHGAAAAEAMDAAAGLVSMTIDEMRGMTSEIAAGLKGTLLGHWWPSGRAPDLSSPDGRVRALRAYLRNTFNSESWQVPFSILREHALADGLSPTSATASDWFAREAWGRAVAYRDAVAQQSLPAGQVDTITVATVTGGTSVRTGTRYGALLVHQRVREGEAPQFHVTHAPSGLRLCGKDGFKSDEQAQMLVRAFLHAEQHASLPLDWSQKSDLNARQEQGMRDVMKAWSEGDAWVPAYFTGEIAAPKPEVEEISPAELIVDVVHTADQAQAGGELVEIASEPGAAVVIDRVPAIAEATESPAPPSIPEPASTAPGTAEPFVVFDAAAAKAMRAALLAAVDRAIEAAPATSPMTEPFVGDLKRLERASVDGDGKVNVRTADAVIAEAKDLFEKYSVPSSKGGFDWEPSSSPDLRISELEGAIRLAARRARQIEIQVPGSPTYGVVNGADKLREFRKIIEKEYPVTAGEARGPSKPRLDPRPVPAARKPKSIGDYIKAMATAVSEDTTRPVLHHVYYDGKGSLVATDGRRLYQASYPGELGDKPIFFHVKTLKPVEVKLDYPHWQRVVPPADRDFAKIEINTAALSEALVVIGTMQTERVPSVLLWVDAQGHVSLSTEVPELGMMATQCDAASAVVIGAYNQDYLRELLRFARGLGHERMTMSVEESDGSPALFEAEGMKIVLMPMRLQAPHLRHPLLEGKWREAEVQTLAKTVQAVASKGGLVERKELDRSAAVLAGKSTMVDAWVIAKWRTIARENGVAPSVPMEEAPVAASVSVVPGRVPAQKPAVPAFDSLPEKTRVRFNAAWEGRTASAMSELLWLNNRGLRAEFERRSGLKLPKTLKGTRDLLASWETPVAQAPAAASETVSDPVEGDLVNKAYTRSLAECRTQAMQPSLSADAFRGAGGGVWASSANANSINFEAHVRVEGAAPSAHAVESWGQIVAARNAGFEMTSYRGRGGSVWVLQRRDELLTKAGAVALASGLFDFPAGAELSTEEYVVGFCRSFTNWLRTLPESTLSSAPAFSAKVNGTPWVDRIKLIFGDGEGPVLVLDQPTHMPHGRFRIHAPGAGGLTALLALVIEWSRADVKEHWASQSRRAEAAVLGDVAAGREASFFLERGNVPGGETAPYGLAGASATADQVEETQKAPPSHAIPSPSPAAASGEEQMPPGDAVDQLPTSEAETSQPSGASTAEQVPAAVDLPVEEVPEAAASPTPAGGALSLEDRIARFRERRAARVSALEAGAAALASKSASLEKGAHQMAERIPFGQPILVGHHSERGDRAYRGRMQSKMRTAMDLGEKAGRLADRAEAAANNTAIFSDDPEAPAKLAEKITALEARQEKMVAANKCVRGNDRAGLAALGFTPTQVEELFKGDFLKRVGFPSYMLTANSAEIRRLKARLADAKATEGQATVREDLPGGIEIEDNVEDNRMRIRFERKPAREVCSYLSSRGFRWAPSEGAWQRHRSARGANLEFLKQVLQGAPAPAHDAPSPAPRIAV